MKTRLVVVAVIAAAVVIAALAVFSRLPITADPASEVEVVSIERAKGDPDKVRQGAKDGKFVNATPSR